MIDYKQQNFDWTLFKRDVRCDIRDCAILLFLFYLINLIASGIYAGIATVSEMANSSVPLALSSIEDMTTTILDGKTIAIMSIVGIVVGSLIFMIRRKKRFFTDITLPAAEPLRPGIFIILVIATQGIQYVTGIISVLVEYILPEGISIVGNYEDIIDMLITPVGMIYVVLVGPIFEELIFRGAIMGPLRKYGDNFAILFSSLLFGLYHGVALQIPFAFVMGLVLGYACVRWSLRTAIALHIISNGISMLLTVEAFAVPGGLGLFVCAVLMFIFLIAYRTKLMERIRVGAPYYGPVTYKNGFSSIAFWLFAAAMIGLAAVQLAGVVAI